MNFLVMNKQRRMIMLASVTGIISLFLPWAEVDLLMLRKNINGFHSYGIAVFTAFAAASAIVFSGDQHKKLRKTQWFISMAAGMVALLFTVVFLVNINDIAGPVAAKGFGIWVSLFAAMAVMVSGWLQRSSQTDLSSFRRSISIPIIMASDINANSVTNKIAELEKLNGLKENGGISEEEFQQLKSQLL